MCLGSALIWVTNGQKAKPDKWLKFMFFSFMILYIIIMTMDGGRHVAPNFKRTTLPLGSWKRQWKYCHHWRLRSRYQKFIYITKGSLLAGYLEFYFAKQRGGLDPLSLNDQEKGNPPSPPSKAPSKGTLAICLVRLFTQQQPLRSVSSSSTSSLSSSSSSSPSSFDLKFGFFDIHFPSTQRCDESDRFEHP